MEPPPPRRKIVGGIQRTATTASPAAASPTPSSASSASSRPNRPPLASSSSSASSTSVNRPRTTTGLSSGSFPKARVKLGNVASPIGDSPGLAPPFPGTPSAGYSWSDGGSDVGSSVGVGTGGSSSKRAPSPASSYVSGTARAAVGSSPRVVGAAAGASSAPSGSRPGQVHARSSPAAPIVGARPTQAGPSRHVRSNSAGLNGLQQVPSARAAGTAVPFPAAPIASTPRSLNASIRSSPVVPRVPPSASAPSTPFSQPQHYRPLASPGGRSSSPPREGGESPPKYFNQLRASIPEDRHLSYSPPPSLPPPPLPPAPQSPGPSPTTTTPDRQSGLLQARRSSASSSFSSSDSPDSRFSGSGSTTSQPLSTSSFSSVSFNPPFVSTSGTGAGAQPPLSPGFLQGLPSIPSSSCLETVSRSPQETIKPTLLEGGTDNVPGAEPDEDPSGKQEKEDAKVNRKIADLEISNASLLAINHMLEAAKAKQAREIRDLRRRFRSGTNLPPPLKRASPSRLSLDGRRSRSSSHSSASSTGSDASSDDDDAEDDPQFARMKELMLSMLEKGMGALAVKVPEPSGWGGGVGGGGGKVLGILEMGEWRDKEGDEEEDDEGTPSPRPEQVESSGVGQQED